MILNDKVAIITGASTGIGREISIALSKEGARVGLIARSIDGLNETFKIIKENNGVGEILPTDLRDVDEILNLCKKVKKVFGKVDVLVNVAGIWHNKDKAYSNIDFEKYTIDEILDTFSVGTIAPSLLSHQLIPLMNNGSRIINLSGTFENGAKGWLPYYVSKRSIEDLTVALSQELKDKGINVNCISPSDTATESYKKFFPQYIEESMLPEDIAKFAVYLCSKESDNTTGRVFVLKKYKKPFENFHY